MVDEIEGEDINKRRGIFSEQMKEKHINLKKNGEG